MKKNDFINIAINKKTRIIFGGLLIVTVIISFLGLTVLALQPDMTEDIPPEIKQLLVTPASAQEIGEDFLCPCCDTVVADCTCGLAKQRQEFLLNELNSGKNKLEIYEEYIKEYGAEEFKDEATAETVKQYLADNAPEDRPIIEILEETIDAGTLSQSEYAEGDKFELEYTVKNVGTQNLIINGIDTSCMCTTAQLILGDQKSPLQGMSHGKQKIEEWEMNLTQNEQAILKVFYDPNAHGDFTGQITRTVTLKSNDPINSRIEVKFDLNQVE